MKFLTDTTVYDFLKMHMEVRGRHESEEETQRLIKKIIVDANTITGEKIKEKMNLLILSGGQSRALMIADLIYVSESPIILIDEIENVGIRVHNALKLLIEEGKIVFIVTHDPLLALNTDKRFVMKNGTISKVLFSVPKERGVLSYLSWINDYVLDIRDQIRKGKQIEELKLVCSPLS